MYRLKKTVVLVGMMGSGKTSVGKALARDLDAPFVDTDEEIERASTYAISELFERFGEVYFREKETQVLLRLLQGPPKILSTGGGAFMNHINQVNISKYGRAVWLRAEVNLLWARVKGKGARPLLMTADPFATLSELYASRTPIYAKAPIHISAYSSHSVADTSRSVINELLKYPDILEVDDDDSA